MSRTRLAFSWLDEWLSMSTACRWNVGSSVRACQYLMCVAGKLSYCRERKSSLWRSWCFCFSVRSVSVGLSFSSSNSSAKGIHKGETYIKKHIKRDTDIIKNGIHASQRQVEEKWNMKKWLTCDIKLMTNRFSKSNGFSQIDPFIQDHIMIFHNYTVFRFKTFGW